MQPGILHRLAFTVLTAILVIPVAADDRPPAPQPNAGGLKLALMISPDHSLFVVFQNSSPKPMVLNLGVILGNGNALFPEEVEIIVTNPGGGVHSFAHHLGGVGGRIDDWLIPIAPYDSYTLHLSPDDLKDEKTSESLKLQNGLRLKAHFKGVDPLYPTSAIPALPVWKGTVDSTEGDAVTAVTNP